MKTLSHFCATGLVYLVFAAAPTGVAHAGGGPGNALYINNSANYVSVPHTNALNAYPFTVTAWFQVIPFGPPVTLDLVKKYDGSLRGWRIQIFNDLVLAVYSASATNYVANGLGMSGGFVSDGSWHHVAFTVDTTGGKLYLDGMQQASQGWTGAPLAPTNTDELRLGGVLGPSNPVDVSLDEVTVWNVALSQSQIQANMNRSLAGNEAGLLAYYRCDESSGTTTADSAPAAGTNDGTLVGPFFITSGIQPFSPFVETLAATILTPTTVLLRGVGNPNGANTSAWFEWGTTTNYGNVASVPALGSGVVNTNFVQLLGGRFPGIAYQFRAMASNSLGVVFGTNQSFTMPTFTFSALTNFGGGDGWLAPGEGGYTFLGTANNERGLAYGNGHIYLVSRSGGNFIRILDPLTGSDLGALNTTGISGGALFVNMVAVGGEGVIYVGNLAGAASTNAPFKVYKWVNEAAIPVVTYSGAPLPGGRVGDSLAAIGSGSSTLLAAGFHDAAVVVGNNGYAIIDPTAGTSAQVTFSNTPPDAGDFKLGITFTDSSHVLGTKGGGWYRYTSFLGTNGILLASPGLGSTTDRMLAYAVVGGAPLLAVQNTLDSTVRIYDVTDPANPILLGSRNNTSGSLTSNAFGVGSLAWGDFSDHSARLYAMSANQGIQAFVVTVLRPKLSATRIGDEIVLSWSGSFSGLSLESSTNVGAGTFWSSVSPSAVISGTNYVVTNSITGDRKFYRFKQ